MPAKMNTAMSSILLKFTFYVPSPLQKATDAYFLTMVTVVIRELSNISTMPLHPMNQFYQKNAATVFCLGEAIL